jgi:hypothetical protein
MTRSLGSTDRAAEMARSHHFDPKATVASVRFLEHATTKSRHQPLEAPSPRLRAVTGKRKLAARSLVEGAMTP